MNRFIFGLLFLVSVNVYSQPWLSALKIAYSSNGTTFNPAATFQDSSGVPSITVTDSGVYICAFQWFPAPINGPNWDSIAVKFSYDTCITWSAPVHCNFYNMPSNFKRPFDPTIVNTGGGQIRMYFSCGPNNVMSLDTSVNTYSAISTDGINYYFESNPRFDSDSLPVIDPAAVYHGGIWHYTAPRGAPQDGAFHATSNDGINFVQAPNITSDASHQWTGNLMENGNDMRFYGAGFSGIWWISSLNGTAWGPYNSTNITQGGDPAVQKLPNGQYVMIYVGPPSTSGIQEAESPSGSVFPNPATSSVVYQWETNVQNARIELLDIEGRSIRTWTSINGQNATLDIQGIPAGSYMLQLSEGTEVRNTQNLIIAK
ncbi:MAG: hypothetical protein RL007_406 [Bacteroidota bacterium]|jgi:hypothetical protein